jgi:hypothetical protein
MTASRYFESAAARLKCPAGHRDHDHDHDDDHDHNDDDDDDHDLR